MGAIKSYQMKVYVFARPDAMKCHHFTDDVAITIAKNKKEAIEIFSEYYAEIKTNEVKAVNIGIGEVAILTDY